MAKQIYQKIGVQAGENVIEGRAPAVKLGIQAPVGTIFYLNGGSSIRIGASGIYELDLTYLGGQIYSLIFNETNTKVQVDVIYEGGQ